MQSFIDLLAGNPLLLLFTVIGVGFLVGNIKIAGFHLGVVAVLFAGIAFGALDQRLALPEFIYIIGLVLFVYAIGLHSGPGFFSSFKKRGLRANGAVVLILFLGGVLTAILSKIMGFSASTAAGLFCGSFTNTPALAASVEALKGAAATLPPGAPPVVAFKSLKIPMSAAQGMMSGMQTQPACLAYANQQVRSDQPNIWYAAVYPASMVAKIIIAQVLVSLLLRSKPPPARFRALPRRIPATDT